MFVLLMKSNGNTIGVDKVMAFNEHYKAHDEMVRQFERMAAADELTLSGNSGDIDACDKDGDGLGTVGYIDECDALLFTSQVYRWVIHELEGVYIDEDMHQSMLWSIRDAKEMYADQTRDDWFEADDICRDVCDSLEDYL